MKKQKFTIVGIVFIIIFLVMFSIIGFYLYNYPKEKPAITPPQITESALKTFDDKQLPPLPPPSPESTQTPKPTPISTKKIQIIVRQSGGSAMLVQECFIKSYLSEKADYIVKGVVENSESKWNEQKTSISTYTDLIIKEYLKGTPFEESRLTIITPGGEIEGIGQSVEDQPIFHQGKKVRIYFQNTSEGFSIVCAQVGVEEI